MEWQKRFLCIGSLYAVLKTLSLRATNTTELYPKRKVGDWVVAQSSSKRYFNPKRKDIVFTLECGRSMDGVEERAVEEAMSNEISTTLLKWHHRLASHFTQEKRARVSRDSASNLQHLMIAFRAPVKDDSVTKRMEQSEPKKKLPQPQQPESSFVLIGRNCFTRIGWLWWCHCEIRFRRWREMNGRKISGWRWLLVLISTVRLL